MNKTDYSLRSGNPETKLVYRLHVGLTSSQNSLPAETLMQTLKLELTIHCDSFSIGSTRGYWSGCFEDSAVVTIVDTLANARLLAGEIAYKLKQDCVMLENASGVVEFLDETNRWSNFDLVADVSELAELDPNEFTPADDALLAELYDSAVAEIPDDSANSANSSHIGSSGLRSDSVGEIYPFHIVLIGDHKIELWGPGYGKNRPYSTDFYCSQDCDDVCVNSFKMAHRRMIEAGRLALAQWQDQQATEDRFRSLSNNGGLDLSAVVDGHNFEGIDNGGLDNGCG